MPALGLPLRVLVLASAFCFSLLPREVGATGLADASRPRALSKADEPKLENFALGSLSSTDWTYEDLLVKESFREMCTESSASVPEAQRSLCALRDELSALEAELDQLNSELALPSQDLTSLLGPLFQLQDISDWDGSEASLWIEECFEAFEAVESEDGASIELARLKCAKLKSDRGCPGSTLCAPSDHAELFPSSFLFDGETDSHENFKPKKRDAHFSLFSQRAAEATFASVRRCSYVFSSL